jgi:hypothetical protein
MFKDITFNRNCLGCLLILGGLVIPVCLFVASVFGVGEDLKRLGKSLEFPAIEARSKPYSDLLASVTQDDFIKEEHNIDNVRLSVTHPEHYTGIVGVTVKMIYGTNRLFVSVQNDFDRFFSAKSEWKIETSGYMTITQHGVACVWLNKTEMAEYPDSWTKYQIVYAIELDYLEPGNSCRLG